MRRLTIVWLVLTCFACAGCSVGSIENILGLGGKKSVTVVVAPKTQSVVVATTQQFTATVTGSSNMGVAWSVGGTDCTSQDCGSISASGLYAAPATIPNPALVAVTATASANSADRGAAAVTIIAATAPAPASAMLRGTYTFLLAGADAEGRVSIGGTFEADGSGQLSNGRLAVCRGESRCADQPFAGTIASKDANSGTFAADILPAASFTFLLAPDNVFKLELSGAGNLHASGVLRPSESSAGN
jgi:hypothetical protein